MSSVKSINLQKKQYPDVYNFRNQYLATLTESIDMQEDLRFGDISRLTFKYPAYQFDVYNNVVLNEDGSYKINPKSLYLINESRILFNNKWYVVKINENAKEDDNKLMINCECFEIGYLLQELMVESLRIVPPLELPVNAQTALLRTLMAMQTVRQSKIASASGSTVTLDAFAHPTNNIYVGYRIYIVSGTGQGQTKTITAYNGTTKQATLNSAFSPQVDSTSVYQIWNPIWDVGAVDSSYNTNLRSHEFDFVNGWDALQQVRDKYLDSSDKVGYLTFTSSYDSINSRWTNYVNLVSSPSYNSREFRYKKNIQSITRRSETDMIYTRIIPEGVDNLTVGSISTENRVDSSITYPAHLFGYNYIDNFQYYLAQGYTYKECLDNFLKVYRFSDARYTDANSLYNDAKKMLQIMSLPKYTYIMSALDLSKLTGFEYESFNLGDTIKVIDEDLGINIFTNIASIQRNWNNPQNATLELTNYIDNLGDVIKRIVGRNDSYTNLKSLYGNTATYIIADKLTSKNWRQADFVIDENEIASDIIQKIIDSVDETKGARIILLDGDYLFNNTITFRNNIYIEGQGASTRLYPNINNLVMFSATNKSKVAINKCQFISPSTSIRISDCFIISNSTDIVFQGNILNDISNSVVTLNTCDTFLCNDNKILNSTFSLSTAFSMAYSKNIDVFNNIGDGKISVILYFNPQDGTDIGRMNFKNNIFTTNIYGNIFGQIVVSPSNQAISGNIKIDGNNLLNISNGSDAPSNYSYPAISVINVNGVVEVTNNTVEGNYSRGIYVSSNKNTIVKNTINTKGTLFGSTQCIGIDVDNIGNTGNNIQSNTIKNDTIYSNTSIVPTTFIGIRDNGTSTVIANNDIFNYGLNAITGAGVGRVLLGGNRI